MSSHATVVIACECGEDYRLKSVEVRKSDAEEPTSEPRMCTTQMYACVCGRYIWIHTYTDVVDVTVDDFA